MEVSECWVETISHHFSLRAEGFAWTAIGNGMTANTV